MDFPLFEVLDEDLCEAWLEKYFHAGQLKCPTCSAPRQRAWIEGRTKRSGLTKYRCRDCRRVYTNYVGTIFAGKHARPSQTILLLRGFAKGESTAGLAREVGMKFDTVLKIRRAVQANAQRMQPTDALPDPTTETDEAFQNAGKKGERHADPEDPPRRRANKQRGHGTYDNDRPPIVGSVGRDTGQVRLRVLKRTDGSTLEHHVHQFTSVQARVNTDEWRGYNHVVREHVTVNHGIHEWARDADGDGVREVHINTTEGLWTGLRNFLRPFRGIHKKHLAGYIAMHEHAVNLKAISPDFIARLVKSI